MIEDVCFSRPMAAAVGLKDAAEDRSRFLDKRVLVTGEPGVLETENGRECFLSSLRLLIRICRNVSVALPETSQQLLHECRETVDRLAFGQSIEYVNAAVGHRRYDAILNIGTTARPELPWTVINSDGWLARVSSGSTDLPACCRQTNPIGALAAAALGTAEVFKRLIRLRPGRGDLLDGLSFSLYTYRAGETDPGPQLPPSLPVSVVLVGVGAIGNGVVHLLSKLPLIGRVWVVDCQKFDPENLGTCLLIGPHEIGVAKAVFAANVLKPRLSAQGYEQDVATFRRRVEGRLRYPIVVLGCVDDIAPRHEIQRLWADLTVDGAIGDFGCQVSRHPLDGDIACLFCLFPEVPGEPAEVVASRHTGLNVARAREGLAAVTEQDVVAAPLDKQDWLRARVGRQICSVIQEALAQQISDESQRPGFQPSVPFVACFSACMVVGEMVKFFAGWPTPLEPRFQLDMLRGPKYGFEVPQQRRRDCVCVTRRHNIETLRRRRRQQVQ